MTDTTATAVDATKSTVALPKRYLVTVGNTSLLAEQMELAEDRQAIAEEIARYRDQPADDFTPLEDFFADLGG